MFHKSFGFGGAGGVFAQSYNSGKINPECVNSGFVNARFWVKNGGVLIDYRFLTIDKCLLVCGVSGCIIKSYGFATRVYGAGMIRRLSLITRKFW